jgi:anti-anti-sigma regulatory factor
MDRPGRRGRLEFLESGPPPVFRIIGDFTGFDAVWVRGQLEKALAYYSDGPLILDMSLCERLDSEGIATLLNSARVSNRRLIVAAPPEVLRCALNTAQMEQIFRLADTIEEAKRQV